jgi:hypothetical protein
MQRLDDRAALLEAVRSLRNDAEAVFAEAANRSAPPPSADGAWTGKDVLAHLTAWRLTTAARLEAALQGSDPAMPWPATLDEERDLDEINRWFFETYRDKPLAEIARESRETFDRVERAIAALPERDLLEVDRFPWLAGSAVGPAVVAGTVEHVREHEPEIRARLAQE